jgi:PAS domain S-box-containing protein
MTEPDRDMLIDADVETSPDMIIGIDGSGLITRWNAVAQRVLGWDSADVLGQPAVTAVVAPRHREMFETMLAAFTRGRLQESGGAKLEIAARHRDGHDLMVEMAFSAVIVNGAPAGMTAVCRDVSERIEAERLAALQDAVDAALSSNLPRNQMIQRLLEGVCSTLGWSAGAMWRPDDAGPPRCIVFWRSPALAHTDLDALSHGVNSEAGDGVVARVLAAADPRWLSDLESSAVSRREHAAARAGMRSAGAVPVRDGREMFGALEFFSAGRGEPGMVRLAQVEAVGLRLGRHLRRAATARHGPARFKLDSRNSHLEFSCAFMKFMTVHGMFRDFSGWMEVDRDDPETARGECLIRTASVDTRSVDRDYHLSSEDFFAVERYPDMVYRSTSVQPLGDERFRILGDLTIRDVTRPIRLDVRLEEMEADASGVARITLTGGTVIKRVDWFLDWEKALHAGRWIVGNEVRLDLVITLVRQAEASAAANRMSRSSR